MINPFVMLRGVYLRTWQRMGRKFSIGIPKEFYNENNENKPAHYGIDRLPIGASGFKLVKCGKDGYHATQLYFDKWGRIKIKHFNQEGIFMSDRHDSKGQGKGPINRHKAMAEGEKITVMKKGGKVKKMAEGGKACMKKGGKAKKEK